MNTFELHQKEKVLRHFYFKTCKNLITQYLKIKKKVNFMKNSLVLIDV